MLFKVLLFVLPLLIFATVVTGLVLSWTSYLSFRETVRQDYTNIIKSSAGEIRAYLSSAETGIEGLAWVLAATRVDPWQQEMALTAYRHIATQFASLTLVSPEGEAPMVVGQRLSEAPADQSEAYRQALGGKTATSGVMFTREHIPYLQIAASVNRLGRVGQVLVAELNLKSIWDVLDGIRVGQTGMVYILDASGTLVGHREIDRVIKALPGVPPGILEQLGSSPDAPVEWSERRGDGGYFCHGVPVADTAWFIVLSQREGEIYEYLYRNLWLALAITLFVSLAAVGLTWSRVRRFLLPVQTLHRQVRRFGRGELDERTSIQSDDEIGELGAAFNDMADSLKEYVGREVETAKELAHARSLATLGATSSKVTHEVGNLLNNVGFTLQVLKSEALGAGSKRAVEILEKDAGRVRNFIQNFLQFAKKPELRLQRASLEGIFRELLYVFRAQAGGRGIQMVLDWPGDLPEVAVDLRLMHQVLNNLLKNSMEALGEGGRIDVVGRVAGDCLEVRVADTGPGIASEIREKIFDPFFTTKGRQGTGLGLAICRTIVEAHRGAIACESEPCRGTAFILKLPLK